PDRCMAADRTQRDHVASAQLRQVGRVWHGISLVSGLRPCKPPHRQDQDPRMTITSEPTLRDLEASLLEMPPVRALQVRLLDDEEGRLRIKAPLSANVNDKGSAFGGSLVSLMTLA